MGSRKGIPNNDKAELRAMVQEAVLEFTRLRHPESAKEHEEAKAERKRILELNEKFIEAGELDKVIPPELLPVVPPIQEIEEEYDPVVALALAAVDVRNKPDLRVRCHADAAQYLRPKLKSIEVKEDPASTQSKREALADMIQMLDKIAEIKGLEYAERGNTATSAEPSS